MKITRLSPTEVVNISALPIFARKDQLLLIEEPRVRWGYDPTTSHLPSLLLAGGVLLGDLPPDKDEALLRSIERRCTKGPEQRAANLAVANAIIKWRNENSVRSAVVYHEPLRSTVDSLRYCADVVPIVNGRPYVIHLDCRSSMSLTPAGKEFMKSLIHHTALVGDLRNAGVAILRTPNVGKGQRRAVLEEMTGAPLFSLDEILARVVETYAIWETILRNRPAVDPTGTGHQE